MVSECDQRRDWTTDEPLTLGEGLSSGGLSLLTNEDAGISLRSRAGKDGGGKERTRAALNPKDLKMLMESVSARLA